MQVPRCSCQWSVDVSVSIHPDNAEIRVDPGMARDAADRHTLKEKKLVWTSGLQCQYIYHIIYVVFSPDFPLSQSGQYFWEILFFYFLFFSERF